MKYEDLTDSQLIELARIWTRTKDPFLRVKREPVFVGTGLTVEFYNNYYSQWYTLIRFFPKGQVFPGANSDCSPFEFVKKCNEFGLAYGLPQEVEA